MRQYVRWRLSIAGRQVATDESEPREHALADPDCAFCLGRGYRFRKNGDDVCACVQRAVFDCALQCYRSAREAGPWSQSGCVLEALPSGRCCWSRPWSDYCADFEMAGRHLDRLQQRIFRLHFVLGCDWRQCAAEIGVNRGRFFHQVYAIKRQIGRRFLRDGRGPLSYFNRHILDPNQVGGIHAITLH